VGMDVVRNNLERIGGMVDLESAAGKGTAVRIKIPLTLAIIPALIVRSNGERFAIPQVSLTELVRLESAQAIERAHNAPVYRLRGQLLPLVYLHRVLYPQRAEKASEPPANACAEVADAFETVNIAVLQAGSRRFGLVVDEVLDTEEIVVKPLGKRLKGISAFAGATIMGDGAVALILDVAGLAGHAGILAGAGESAPAENVAAVDTGASESQASEYQEMLLAESGGGRVAIPLSAVARLEEFPASVIEHAGMQEVMQYRGQIIPLIRLSPIAGNGVGQTQEPVSIQVVVHSSGGRTVGLVVDRIVDIVSANARVESVQPRRGVAGTCVLDQRVTDLLDVSGIVREIIPGFLETRAEASS
jgi:two-component system, chemotaxis family, sensor kinase CheA